VMNHGRFEQLGTPQQLYYQPQTAFVAGFVGNNNRFEGTIESRNGEQVLLRTASGLGLWSQRVGAVDVGQTATLFIRPEAIEIGRSPRELPAALLLPGGRAGGGRFRVVLSGKVGRVGFVVVHSALLCWIPNFLLYTVTRYR